MSSFNFPRLVEHLETIVKGRYCLTFEQNPVMRNLSVYSNETVGKVVKEYSQFSNEAIHLLLDARIRVSDWTLLAQEVDRNLEEEKGSETEGVPHLEIMRRGYLQGLGFDVNAYVSNDETQDLLETLRRTFRRKNNAYLAGALLALESVSVAEFYVLEQLLKRMGAENKHLTLYVDGHKLFEVGHKEGLMRASEKYVDEDNSPEFCEGYLAVCEALSTWWTNVAQS